MCIRYYYVGPSERRHSRRDGGGRARSWVGAEDVMGEGGRRKRAEKGGGHPGGHWGEGILVLGWRQNCGGQWSDCNLAL